MITLNHKLLAHLSPNDRSIVEKYISALQDRLPEIGEIVGVAEVVAQYPVENKHHRRDAKTAKNLYFNEFKRIFLGELCAFAVFPLFIEQILAERENYLVVRVAIRHDNDIIEIAEKMADVSTDLLLETGRLVVATGT